MPRNGVLLAGHGRIYAPRRLKEREEPAKGAGVASGGSEQWTDEEKKEVDRLVQLAKEHMQDLKRKLFKRDQDPNDPVETEVKAAKVQKQPIRLAP